MAIYLGSQKQILSLGTQQRIMQYVIDPARIQNKLVSFDNFILTDSKGTYLTSKETNNGN